MNNVSFIPKVIDSRAETNGEFTILWTKWDDDKRILIFYKTDTPEVIKLINRVKDDYGMMKKFDSFGEWWDYLIKNNLLNQ